MKKHLYRAGLWLAVLTLMALIFGFSAQSGDESGVVSGIITQPITEALSSMHPDLQQAEMESLYILVDQVIRKTAHFCEYALLGFLICLLCRSYGILSWRLPWLIGSVYAVTDEVHQLFQPARSCQVSDIILDACGAFFGVMFIGIIKKIRRSQ
ncbi:MAG: VanZ family protein [Clostridia bacterium]|nr:VanZ family protein [Clostridia bacterium]